MQYKDLLQFEPIESVIQLKDANNKDRAFQLLDTYVISDRMAEQLNDMIINQLQFDRSIDNKGLLIVGNYGTGKSHLMSVISTIAEREGASAHISNPSVAEKSKDIEGKFKVIRLEIGSVGTSLRDILVSNIEDGLAEMDVNFTFPSFDKITNNKDALEEMMGLFNEKYPKHGLLIVVDELLDYLRGRKEQEITLDLGFLRELGEICSKTRLRFIAGIQEMLFDNPSFSFVAEPLRRVKERFEQVRIVREDIAHVVSERLLKKNEEQKALIREHLSKFTTLYGRLNEDMEAYVNLFPIHPAYLSAFEKVNGIEKRVALKTISIEMNSILDKELPEEEPGLISYDSYWKFIEEDPSYKSNPDVKEVMDKAKILKDRVQNALEKRAYKPMSLRIINALSLYRLSTSDIYDKVGLTAEELRDELLLTPPGGMDLLRDLEDASDFLKTNVDAAVREIQKTVSYQYLSANESNGQYYLDLKKDIDIDSLIQQKAEKIEDDKLDRFYYDILKQAITLDDNTYVSGYKIWRHNLPWDARRITRQGYLFFGAPNERSTAQPERDFYIYMLRPYLETPFKDEQKPDELFFELNQKDERFTQLLRLYAAANDLKAESASATRNLYTRKIESYFKEINKWLNDNFVHSFEITYKGKKGSVLEFGMFLPANVTIQEIINIISEGILTDWFAQKYEDYPSFRKIQGSYLSKNNLETYVRDALYYLNGKETKQGESILDGLVLLDPAGKVSIKQSGYAAWVVDLLEQKGHGQVVNHNELIETVFIRGVEDLQYTKQFYLEPELLVVLFGAMIYTGTVEVTVEGKTYNASNLQEYIQLPLPKLAQFSHIKKPTGLPIAELNAVADLFDERIANYEDEMLKRTITTIAGKANNAILDALNTIQIVKKGFPTWDGPLLNPAEIQENVSILEEYKDFCEGLKRYDTPAKMRNLKYDLKTIEKQKEAINKLGSFKKLEQQIKEIQQRVSYLQIAQPNVGSQSEWSSRVDDALDELQCALKQHQDTTKELTALDTLKKEYIQLYIEAHDQSRLNASENMLKNALLNDAQTKALKELAAHIPILPKEELFNWERTLSQLKTCYHVTKEKLEHTPICSECKFRPTEVATNEKSTLKKMQEELPDMLTNWTETLLANFNDPSVKENISLLKPEQQQFVDALIANQAFTLPLDIRLIQAINDLLKGIHKVEVSISDIEEMMANGHPLAVDELRKRFEDLLTKKVGATSTNRVRIMLKK
ncbi:ATP-binding protein [Planococcus sp. ANT_H30]|nr:ATP-binding protein [Planococcus sp. ANT_H30]